MDGRYLATTIWGYVSPPPGVSRYSGGSLPGLQIFVQNIVRTLIIIAGTYAFINLLLAGYSFMSAVGNPEKIAQAWAKIWQTLLGLLVAAGSFVIAGIAGELIFGDPNALLQLRFYSP